jgi:hypothetical protein
MMIDTEYLKPKAYYQEGDSKALSKDLADKANIYKRKVAGAFVLVEGSKIHEKITGTDFCVTKKLDGMMHLVFLRESKVFAVTRNGIVRMGLPCLKEFADLAQKANLTSVTVAAELYVKRKDGSRERVSDVSIALGDESQAEMLNLAPFDLIDVNDEPFVAEHYKETLAQMNKYFSGNLVKPVENKNAESTGEIEAIFNEWVTEGGAEGVVIHSELPIVFKVKTRHTVDLAVIGYTTTDDDGSKVRDVMVAAIRDDGKIQQIGNVGIGLSDAQRSEFYARLSKLTVPSEFIETDSRNIAYQMVKPQMVLELSALDFVAENAAGEPKLDALVSYSDEAGYISEGQTAGVSAISLSIVGVRDDKKADATDVRLSQITDICPFAQHKGFALSALTPSEILQRRIFTKGSGEKFMIQKFVVWKTNKDESGLFPAFVFHYTDFSNSRKEFLKRDIRTSSSEKQIMDIYNAFIADNVKKGWEELKQ